MPTEKSPAFQFYYKEWLTGTRIMTRIERDIYLSLLIYSYDLDGLPDDMPELQRIAACRNRHEVKALQYVLRKFEKGDDGRLRNLRMERVRVNQTEFKKQMTDRGKKAAQARWHRAALNGQPVKVVHPRAVEAPYVTPEVFLQNNMPADLEAMHKQSGLPAAEFATCLRQWSLKCESGGWQYTADTAADLKRLRAGFQKWLNTWVINTRKEKFINPAGVNGHREERKIKKL
jgi:uncharacterized protein YdaU (DUF1376 family)